MRIASALATIFLFAFPHVAVAAVPSGYVTIAQEYGLPAGLLFAVATVESRAEFSGLPWPWTLNVRGKPLYFAHRADAVRHLKELLASGETMVDVGPMQVNWYWHADALRSAEYALDPYYNLRVGAAHLRELYLTSPNWATAIGRYHSPSDPGRAAAYAARVIERWKRVAS